MESLTEIQGLNGNKTFVAKIRGVSTPFQWQAPSKEDINIKPYSDFMDAGRAEGLRGGLLDVIWEQVDKYLNPEVNYKASSDGYNVKWREEFLNENPEFKNKAYLPPEDIERAEIVGSAPEPDQDQQAIISISAEHSVITVSDFLSNQTSSDFIGAVVKNICNPYQLIKMAWIHCNSCFNNDVTKFFPPMDSRGILHYVTKYESCPNCGRTSVLELMTESIMACDITIGEKNSSATLEVVGVQRFDLKKGDIVVVAGRPEMSDKIKLRCYRIKVVEVQIENTAVSNRRGDIDDKIRKLFFEICKRESLKYNSAVLFMTGLSEIYENNEDCRTSTMFKVADGQANVHGSFHVHTIASLTVPPNQQWQLPTVFI